MFKKLFGKKTPAPEPKTDIPADPARESLFRAIEEKKKEDPYIGVKIGSKEYLNQLIGALQNNHGVHIESLLAILGSLAGFTCQMSIRELNNGAAPFTVVEDDKGRKYFFGDALNAPLLESDYSFWSVAAGVSLTIPGMKVPDVMEIITHVAGSIGDDAVFGVPRVADGHQPGDLPVNYVRDLWPRTEPFLKDFCDTPAYWPMFFGIAVQEAIVMGKDVIDPTLALQIVMECAIPMSKIDPAALTPAIH